LYDVSICIALRGCFKPLRILLLNNVNGFFCCSVLFHYSNCNAMFTIFVHFCPLERRPKSWYEFYENVFFQSCYCLVFSYLCKPVLESMFSLFYIRKTRLKRLPVISHEHFRKTRTNYFYKHLFGISNSNLQNGISNTSA
jgi:hypothetical protein